MPWTTLLPVDASSCPVPPSVWGAAGVLHGDISMHRPLLPGLSHRCCLPSPAGTLLWVAVCDHLLSPHRSLATWGSSTVKWSLWMALCTVTHTQATCWWRSAQPLARLTLSSWIMGSTRYVSMRGFQGLVRLSLGIKDCSLAPLSTHFSYYFHNPPMIFFDSEMEDRTQVRDERLFPVSCPPWASGDHVSLPRCWVSHSAWTTAAFGRPSSRLIWRGCRSTAGGLGQEICILSLPACWLPDLGNLSTRALTSHQSLPVR